MRRKLHLLPVAMLACGAVAGCGGGGDSNGGSSSSNPKVQQAVDSCKQSVDQAQSLSAGVKKDLKDLCEKAGSGDENAVRKASEDVCVKIVEETIPAGDARDQSVKACKQSSSAQ
jgi:hypothetical protein